MKAFLLAAGEGRRLLPLTFSTPKCLVPIGGRPLLSIWLELLERSGVDAVLLNVHHLREKVQAYLDTCGTKLRVECVFEKRLLGSAGTVASNRTFVEGEEEFLILYADNLTNCPLRDLLEFHRSRDGILTLGVTVTDRPREKGVVVVEHDGRVVGFQEKPENPRSNLANAGIYAASPKLFDYLPGPAEIVPPLDFGYHVFPALAGRIHAFALQGFLMDIGTPTAYAQAQAEWPGLDHGSS